MRCLPRTRSRSTVPERRPDKASAEQQDAYPRALRLLAGRDFTAKAPAARLIRGGADETAVAVAIERLERDGFLNDRRYAERFVEYNREQRRYSGYRLRQELQRRGVPPELIATLLTAEASEVDQLAQACELVQRRYREFNPATASEQERRRVAGFLQRRGYGGDVVWQVVRGASDS